MKNLKAKFKNDLFSRNEKLADFLIKHVKKSLPEVFKTGQQYYDTFLKNGYSEIEIETILEFPTLNTHTDVKLDYSEYEDEKHIVLKVCVPGVIKIIPVRFPLYYFTSLSHSKERNEEGLKIWNIIQKENKYSLIKRWHDRDQKENEIIKEENKSLKERISELENRLKKLEKEN